MERGFEIGDWCISLIDTNYGRKKGDLLELKANNYYSYRGKEERFSDNVNSKEIRNSIRLAEQHEIPIEHRKEQEIIFSIF